MAFLRVLARDELWIGEMRVVLIGRVPVLLVNVGGLLRAYEDCCAHQHMRLSEGRLDGCALTCAAHGWTYNAATGRGLNPAGVELRRFPLRIDGEAVLVDIEGGA
jgi:toluene monooxygenase system ferredoxin subunit